ncbi:MAG: ABC transporter permease [Blastopirellula sp. JB062]
MTTIETSTPGVANLPDRQPVSLWERIDAWAEYGSEFLNPILVKETRQALKSKQFAIMFTLVLACGWGWSLLGVAVNSPTIYYSASGPFMLVGYVDILLFPLVVIIPFSTFRSLAGEREDGTYELLSVSSLPAAQIISGKLGSALLQMIVYLSALAPCIAFTYLLRGIDIIAICYVLTTATLVSALLSMAGLLIATFSSAKSWQSVLSVGVIVLLLCAYYLTARLTFAAVLEVTQWRQYDVIEFWVWTLGALTIYFSYFALLYFAASAAISFASENRSTKLRVVILAQHFLFFFWFCWAFVATDYAVGFLSALITVLALHWGYYGALAAGESPVLSSRVRRTIPGDVLSRLYGNWFLPGPARGYFFAVSGMLSAAAAVLMIAQATREIGNVKLPDLQTLNAYVAATTSYVVIYLGVGRLLMIGLRRVGAGDIFLSAIIHLLLVMFGVFVPLIIQLSSSWIPNNEYSLVQIINPFWTLAAILSDPITGGNPTLLTSVILLAIGAVMTLVLQIILSAGDIAPVRQAAPQRVIEEERSLVPAATPEPESPWDDA